MIGERYTVELDREELRITRAALRSFLDAFGHDEREVHDVIRSAMAKLPAEEQSQTAA